MLCNCHKYIGGQPQIDTCATSTILSGQSLSSLGYIWSYGVNIGGFIASLGAVVAKTLLDTVSLQVYRVNSAAPILVQHKNSNRALDRPSISASGNSFEPI